MSSLLPDATAMSSWNSLTRSERADDDLLAQVVGDDVAQRLRRFDVHRSPYRIRVSSATRVRQHAARACLHPVHKPNITRAHASAMVFVYEVRIRTAVAA